MPTYTAISATEVQAGKPITESLMTRLVNNLLAVVEGDPTAPIIYPSIMPQNSGSVYGLTERSNGAIISSNGSWRTMLTITFDNNFGGAVEADVDMSYYITSQNASDSRLLLNGSTIETFGALNTSVVTKQSLVRVSIPTGTNTLTFEINTVGTIARIYGSMKVKGLWL